MDFFELSLQSHVTYESLREFLASTFHIEQELIGDDTQYWDQFDTVQKLAIGMEIFWSDIGYRTFLRWIQEPDISDPQLLDMALKAAKHFNTDVAIGDVLGDWPDGFLICKPDGSAYHAVEDSEDEGEFEIYSSQVTPAEIQRFLSQIEKPSNNPANEDD